MTYDEAQDKLENIQEKWSELEQSIPDDHFLNKPENRAILNKLMTSLDQTLYHVRMVTGDE
jgi:hypothetical protein